MALIVVSGSIEGSSQWLIATMRGLSRACLSAGLNHRLRGHSLQARAAAAGNQRRGSARTDGPGRARRGGRDVRRNRRRDRLVIRVPASGGPPLAPRGQPPRADRRGRSRRRCPMRPSCCCSTAPPGPPSSPWAPPTRTSWAGISPRPACCSTRTRPWPFGTLPRPGNAAAGWQPYARRWGSAPTPPETTRSPELSSGRHGA